MKIFAGLKLHPRGFLGAPLEYRSAHPSRPIQIDFIGTATRKITLENEDNNLTPNNAIEELYREAISHEDVLKRNFAFRERLFVAALSAFGTSTINEWIAKQKENPYFDTMQNRFVEETVGYVCTGFRKYHPQVYLDTVTVGTKNSFDIGPNVREHIVNVARIGSGHEISIKEFVQRWLSQRDGLSDLLISLRVLFGS